MSSEFDFDLRKLGKMGEQEEKRLLFFFSFWRERERAGEDVPAIQCLKRKRLYEQRIEQLRYFQLQIRDQIIMLEGAKATTETVDALRTRAAATKAMQEAKNINDLNNISDKINEQNETMKRMQEAVSAPSGAAAVFDEDELEAELEELKGPELEEQLLLPAATAPAPAPLPAVPQGTDKEDELADLQAEMAFWAGRSFLIFSRATVEHFIVVGLLLS
ncbi:hypothetical protein ACJRO7_014007 [Eucalyptus globulus]|uniref:Uncharacterized protein n=1 Tax=Eucalyptus globulus TaxID=34317 RepID=A0ABD3KYP8_EUCGL